MSRRLPNKVISPRQTFESIKHIKELALSRKKVKAPTDFDKSQMSVVIFRLKTKRVKKV